MWNCTNFFRANHENEVEAQRSEKLPIKQKCQSLFTWLCTKGKGRLGECEIALIFFGQIIKMRSKRSVAKNCLSSKNVNLCLLDSVESIMQWWVKIEIESFQLHFVYLWVFVFCLYIRFLALNKKTCVARQLQLLFLFSFY